MLAPRLLHASTINVDYHKTQMRTWVKRFGELVVPAIARRNQIDASMQSFASVIKALNQALDQFIHKDENYFTRLTEDPLCNAMSLLRLSANGIVIPPEQFKAKFFDDLCMRQEWSLTLCSYLICAKELLDEHSPLHADKDFNTLIAYTCLIASTFAYNAAYLKCKYIGTEKAFKDVKNLIDAYHKWMFLFETLKDCHDWPACVLELKQTLSKNTQLFEKMYCPQLGYRTMPLHALHFHISRRNLRAIQFGGQFNGYVLFNPDATEFYLPNADVLAQLYKIIEEMRQSDQPIRKQVVLVFNRELGQVNGFDIYFDPTQQKISLLNISPSKTTSQYYLLDKVQAYLKHRGLSVDLFACQADRQGERYSDPYYVYALLGASANLLPHTFAQFHTEQPTFSDIRIPRAPKTYPKLENVKWISIAALGEKALLMGPTTEVVRQDFDTHVKQNVGKKLAFYADKYGKPYAAYLCDELDRRYQSGPANTIEAILLKLKTQDRGQALRRAASGLCPRAEFDELLRMEEANPTGALNAQDTTEGKHYTPLMCSLSSDYDKASRASALCQAKCDLSIKDAKERDASAYYESALETSQVKRNTYLKRLH